MSQVNCHNPLKEKMIKYTYIYTKIKNTQNYFAQGEFSSDNVTKESKKVITIKVRFVVTTAKGSVYDQKQPQKGVLLGCCITL